MPPTFPAHTYRVTIAYQHDDTGHYAETGFHWVLDDDPVGTAFDVAKELAEEFWADKGGQLLGMIPDDVTVLHVSCKRIDAEGPAAVFLVNESGAAPGGCETIGEGPLIAWYGDSDPVLTGRTYYPGITSDSYDGGSWDAAFLAAAAAHIADMIVAIALPIATVSATFFIVSYQIGVLAQTVKEGLLRAVPATQRLRKRN